MNDDRIEVSFPNPYTALEPWLATVSAANPALPSASALTDQPDTVLVSQLRHDVRGILTITQPLYQPVSAPLREQGEAVEASARAGTDATRQGVRDAVESLWFQALRYRELQRVSGRNAELAALNLRRAQQANELGVAQAFDVRRAEFALTQAQTAYASAGAGYRAIREQLAGALSLGADFEPAPPADLDPQAVLALEVTAWQSRPEVLANESRAASIEANAEVARATRLPFANVSGTVTPHTVTDFQDDAVDWFIQASVQWNAWDGGIRRAQADRLLAQADQVRWQALDTARQFEANHAAARMTLLDSINRRTQAQAQVTLAESEFDTLNRAFAAGGASRLEVDSSLLRRFEAETLLAVAEVDVQEAAYRVRRLARWGS
jgi:outer membrane protein TolC